MGEGKDPRLHPWFSSAFERMAFSKSEGFVWCSIDNNIRYSLQILHARRRGISLHTGLRL
jgi:hypothetical protein